MIITVICEAKNAGYTNAAGMLDGLFGCCTMAFRTSATVAGCFPQPHNTRIISIMAEQSWQVSEADSRQTQCNQKAE